MNMRVKSSSVKIKTSDFLKKTIQSAKDILASIHSSKIVHAGQILASPRINFDVDFAEVDFVIDPKLINLLSTKLQELSGNLRCSSATMSGYVSALSSLSLQDLEIASSSNLIAEAKRINQGTSNGRCDVANMSTELPKTNTCIVLQPSSPEQNSHPASNGESRPAIPSSTTFMILNDSNPTNGRDTEDTTIVILQSGDTSPFNDTKVVQQIEENIKEYQTARPSQIEPYRIIDTLPSSNTQTILNKSGKQVDQQMRAASSERQSKTPWGKSSQRKTGEGQRQLNIKNKVNAQNTVQDHRNNIAYITVQRRDTTEIKDSSSGTHKCEMFTLDPMFSSITNCDKGGSIQITQRPLKGSSRASHRSRISSKRESGRTSQNQDDKSRRVHSLSAGNHDVHREDILPSSDCGELCNKSDMKDQNILSFVTQCEDVLNSSYSKAGDPKVVHNLSYTKASKPKEAVLNLSYSKASEPKEVVHNLSYPKAYKPKEAVLNLSYSKASEPKGVVHNLSYPKAYKPKEAVLNSSQPKTSSESKEDKLEQENLLEKLYPETNEVGDGQMDHGVLVDVTPEVTPTPSKTYPLKKVAFQGNVEIVSTVGDTERYKETIHEVPARTRSKSFDALEVHTSSTAISNSLKGVGRQATYNSRPTKYTKEKPNDLKFGESSQWMYYLLKERASEIKERMKNKTNKTDDSSLGSIAHNDRNKNELKNKINKKRASLLQKEMESMKISRIHSFGAKTNRNLSKQIVPDFRNKNKTIVNTKMSLNNAGKTFKLYTN